MPPAPESGTPKSVEVMVGDLVLEGDWTSDPEARLFVQGDRTIERVDGYRLEITGTLTIETAVNPEPRSLPGWPT